MFRGYVMVQNEMLQDVGMLNPLKILKKEKNMWKQRYKIKAREDERNRAQLAKHDKILKQIMGAKYDEYENNQRYYYLIMFIIMCCNLVEVFDIFFTYCTMKMNKEIIKLDHYLVGFLLGLS